MNRLLCERERECVYACSDCLSVAIGSLAHTPTRIGSLSPASISLALSFCSLALSLSPVMGHQRRRFATPVSVLCRSHDDLLSNVLYPCARLKLSRPDLLDHAPVLAFSPRSLSQTKNAAKQIGSLMESQEKMVCALSSAPSLSHANKRTARTHARAHAHTHTH